MKKITYAVFVFAISMMLSACSSPENLADYVEVSFSGLDTNGTAEYEVDRDELLEEGFDDDATLEDVDDLADTYEIELDKTEDLSNGDTVTVTAAVDEEETDKIEAGEKEVTVEGLEEPDILETKDVERNLALKFDGGDGRGFGRIRNEFDDQPFNEMDFKVKDNGMLENGQEAEIIIDEKGAKKLHSNGYVRAEDFHPTFEVEELFNVAEHADEISNLKDIENKISNKMSDMYSDTEESVGITYEYERVALMYRQFDDEEDVEGCTYISRCTKHNHGNLIGIYAVEKTDSIGTETDFTAIAGYSDIKISTQGKGKLSEMEVIKDRTDESPESVIEEYESKGYKIAD